MDVRWSGEEEAGLFEDSKCGGDAFPSGGDPVVGDSVAVEEFGDCLIDGTCDGL